MFSRENSKGFSLVELLAAIVMMGILTGIGIVSVTYLINKTEKEYYKAQESEIIMAAKSYTQDNRSFLPKRVGQKNQIYLKTLQSKKYIGEIVDRNKKKCDPDLSYVQVYRYSKNNYSYVVNLVCDGYTSEDSSPTNLVGPDIKFVFEGIGSNDSYDLAKVTVTIEDEDKISGYRYIITKNGNEVKNSGDIDGKLEKKIEFTLPLKEFVPGVIEIKVVATDFYGNESTKSEKKTILNSEAPTCTVLQENDTWTNNIPVQTQAKCNDFTGLGCKKDVYTQDFYGDARISVIEIEDNAGNKGMCNVKTYIDVTPPTGPIIENAYENQWINKSYAIKIKSTDETSGIAFIEYRYPDSTGLDSEGNPENEWHRYANSSSDPGVELVYTTTNFSKERGEYVEIRVCDNAGNCSSNKSMIKIDKTTPSCSISRSPASPNGNNGWYTTNVTVSMGYTEPAGTGDRAVASPVSAGLGSTSGSTSTVQSDTSGITYTGYVSDAAGNSSTCSSGSFKVDTTNPTCSLSKSGTAGDGNWYRSNVTVSISKSDNLSGVAGYDVSSSGSPSYSNSSSKTASSEGSNSWYGYVKDNAGNTGSCSISFSIDKTKPTISTDSVSSGTTWCAGKKTISVSCSDSLSGMKSASLSGAVSSSGTSSASATLNSSGTVTYTCIDKAGNVSTTTKSVKAVTKSCVANDSCRHSSFGCESYTPIRSECEQAESGNYVWNHGLRNANEFVSTCTVRPLPTCSKTTLGKKVITACTCNQYKYGTGSVCGCAKYNCTD